MYRVTIIDSFGNKFVNLVSAESKLEAALRAYNSLKSGENIESIVEVN